LTVEKTLDALLLWLADWQIVPVGLLASLFVFLPGRLPLSALALALLAIPLLWVAYRVTRGRFIVSTPLDLPLLVWMLTLPIGLWASPFPEISLPLLLQELVAIALFYALLASLRTADKLKLVSITLLVGTALLAVVGLLGMQRTSRLAFLSGNLFGMIPPQALSFWDPESTGFNANITAGVLTMFVPATVAYAWTASRGPLRLRTASLAVLLWLLVAGEVLVLVLTRSQGAIAGFVAALIVVALGRDLRWARLLPVVLVVAFIAFALYGTQPFLGLALGGIGEGLVTTAEGRLELVSRGLYMLQDFPLTGIGLGAFSRVLPALYPLFLVGPDVEMPHVHNLYLQAGIDHGLPGLIAFLAMLFLLWFMGNQSLRRSRGRPWEPLALGLLAGFAAFLVHGLVDVVSSSPRVHILIWSHWGLLAAVWCWTQAHQVAPGE
jgi:putative inorganic carbon (HCO3(-)) transporter